MRLALKLGSLMLAAQVTCAGVASAQADHQCDGPADGAFSQAIGLARVASTGQLSFVHPPGPGRADCPGPSAKCRAKPYLMPGDVVLTSPGGHNGFICASFVNRRGVATHGWLPADRLTPIPANAADDAAWIGNWQRVEASIKITRGKDGALSAEGDATWGAGDKGRVARGAVNLGEFAGKLRRTGDTALVADDDIASFEAASNDSCVVRMRAAGPYLIVEDNRVCGGMNVSFSGLYQRR
jgi:hypothetical protein